MKDYISTTERLSFINSNEETRDEPSKQQARYEHLLHERSKQQARSEHLLQSYARRRTETPTRLPNPGLSMDKCIPLFKRP